MRNSWRTLGLGLAAALLVLALPEVALAQIYTRPTPAPYYPPPYPPPVVYYPPAGPGDGYYAPAPLVIGPNRYSFYEAAAPVVLYPTTTNYRPGDRPYTRSFYTPVVNNGMSYYSGYYTPGYFRY
jgi:hypothetical protein